MAPISELGWRATGDRRTAFEFPLYSGDADRQQAFSCGQRAHGACVEDQAAGELQVVGQPLLAGGRRRV